LQLRRESSGQSEDRSGLFSPESSDVVLMRCRQTIERLHAEAEAERTRSVELRRQAAALEGDLQAARAELEQERGQRLEVEALSSRLERRAVEAESRLEAQRGRDEVVANSLQQAKSELAEKTEELRGARERVATSEREATLLMAKLEAQELEFGTTLERLATSEQEASRLRAAAAASEEARRQQALEAERSAAECRELRSLLGAREAEAGRRQRQEALERDLATAFSELSECRAQRDGDRAELRRSQLGLEEAKAERDRAQKDLFDVRSEARSDGQARSAALRSRLDAADRELERGRAALRAEEEKSRQMQDELRRSEDQARRRSEDADALADMLAQTQRHVAELELGRREAEKTSASCTFRARDAEREQRANAELEGKVERLRQKYRHNMAKMYRHLSEREAYEQKLKDYIENEVGVLRQYSHELEDYWRGRCSQRRSGAPQWNEEEEEDGEELGEDYWRPPRPLRRRPSSGPHSQTPCWQRPPPRPPFQEEEPDEAGWERRWELPF